MNKSLLKYSFVSVFAFLIMLFSIFVFSNTSAYAWTTTDWRPSVEILKCIDSNTAQINEFNKNIEDSKIFINEYESSSGQYEFVVNQLQLKFDDMEKYIQEERPELEELTKNSYATFFAKNLLDKIVGNRFITDGLFRWGIVTFIASSEDDEILAFVEDYYKTKDDLEFAIQERDNAKIKYQQSLSNIANLPNEITTCNNNLNYLNNLLPQIYEIESVYGAAGESRIEGSNIFCHPCPDGQLSSYFGEARDGYSHHGTDFSANVGTPVYAAADGVVIETGTSDSMGNFIKIQHDGGLVTVYMHCSHIFVPNGMHVYKGSNIALVGNTGDSEGPHLHFQVELNGSPVNGLDYL